MAKRKTTKKRTTRKQQKQELIPAVGYLRKSTKGKLQDGSHRQEASLKRQKEVILEIAKGRYDIIAWFEDDGISGTKMGLKRPGFDLMIRSVKELGAKAVVCEKLDRFARAKRREVERAADALIEAGVKWVVTRGTVYDFDLIEDDDLGATLNFVIDVLAAHKYAKDLGERVSSGKLLKILEGKRVGAVAPYGMAINGKGLKPGKASEVKIVRFIFDEFVKGKSMHAISGELNDKGVKTMTGAKWSTQTVKDMLKRHAYVGDLQWNDNSSQGKFFTINKDQKVVKKTDDVESAPIILKNCWRGIISRTTWNRAQKRLEEIHQKREKPRGNNALSGILYCDNCGNKMYPQTPKGRKKIYRCATVAQKGSGCHAFEIKEYKLLPFLVERLYEEMSGLEREMLNPKTTQSLNTSSEQKAARQERIEDLDEKIKTARENLMFASDAETRDYMDKRIQELIAERASLLDVVQSDSDDDTKRFFDWWKSHKEGVLKLPVDEETREYFAEVMPGVVPKVMIAPADLNSVLRVLGAEVRLRFKTTKKTRKDGSTYNSHEVVRGRFRLGQQSGPLDGHLISTLNRCD